MFDDKVFALGAAQITFVVAAIPLIPIIQRIESKGWKRVAYLSLILFGVYVFYIGFKPKPDTRVNDCNLVTADKAFDQPPPPGAGKGDYVSVTMTVPIKGRDIKTLRIITLKALFEKADSVLSFMHKVPYAANLITWYSQQDALGTCMVEMLRKNFYISIKESVDHNNCLYTLHLYVAKEGAEDIGVMEKMAKDTICLVSAIRDMLHDAMVHKGVDNLTFYNIFSTLCEHCPGDPRVIEWKKMCQTGVTGCDNFYFQKGEYALSIPSVVLLNTLCQQLKVLNRPVTVTFSGYTDPSPVYGIPYSGKADTTSLGNLLPGPGGVPVGSMIHSNEALSFCRAYSCYELFKQWAGRNITTYYTGYGPAKKGNPEVEQRTVTILLKF